MALSVPVFTEFTCSVNYYGNLLYGILSRMDNCVANIGRISFTYMYKLWRTLQWFSWNSHLLNRITLRSSTCMSVTSVQKCALFGRMSLDTLKRNVTVTVCVFMYSNLCLLGNLLWNPSTKFNENPTNGLFTSKYSPHKHNTQTLHIYSYFLLDVSGIHTDHDQAEYGVQKEKWYLYCNWLWSVCVTETCM